MWNQQGCPRHWLWPHGDGRACPPVEVPAQSAAQPFLSCRTSTGGWSQGGAWHCGSWLVLLGPRQTRPQAMGSCHALTTCSCSAVLWQINKRTSADKLSSVYPQGLLPEPATPCRSRRASGSRTRLGLACLPLPFLPMGALLWRAQEE